MDSSSEHLKVAIRVRPVLATDPLRDEILYYGEVIPTQDQSLRVSDGEHYLEIKYDRVFQPAATQAEVFEFVRPAVEGTVKGYNCTLFAYGQTGSGKTYTMFGAEWETNNPAPQVYYKRSALKGPPILTSDPLTSSDKFGMVPQSVRVLFHAMASKPYTAYCSFLQIYNEKLYDLLQDPSRARPLNIREDRESGIYVEQLAEFVVQTEDDCFELIRQGDRSRAVRQTKYNNHSSRSHTIFQLLLESDRANKRGTLKRAKLNLCDLAGSEKYDKEGMMETTHVKELASINQSLSALGKVIAALGASAAHIPYRDSKLTRLLQDSLDETISTLKFADRARQVMVKVYKNEVSATNDKLVSKLQREVQYLKSLLDMRRRGGMEQIHHELWSLREENEKLRSIAGGVSIAEVERLRNENKQLRVELQKLGNQTSMEESGGSFFVTAEGSKPSSAAEVMSVPEYVQARASSKEGQQPVAQDIYSLMSRKGTDIQATLDALRKHDLQVAAESLKKKITTQGRCPVCTLKVPCKHYQDVSELPTIEDQENADPTLDASSISEKVNAQLPELRARKEASQPASQRTPRPPRSANHSVDPSRPLTYRSRGITNVPKLTPANLLEMKRAEERKSALKEAEKKLATLERLEKYREEKLRREIERLEEERQAEEAQVKAEQAREEKRQQYLQKQKDKLVAYELQRRREQEELKDKSHDDEERQKRQEKKAKKSRQQAKKQIENYHLKKRVLDGIISDQVQSLGTHYAEEDVLRRDKDSIQALYDANE